MYKISFLCLLFSLLLLPYARAQDEEPYPYVPIPTDTAYKWNVMTGYMDWELNADNQTLYPGEWSLTNGFQKTRTYSFLGEITIDGKQYHRMRDMPGTDLHEVYIRQDSVNRMIYWKRETHYPEQILYKFNVNVGDTVVADKLMDFASFYVVDSIHYLNIDEITRKAIYFHAYSNLQRPFPVKPVWDVWIEGIGSIYGIIHGPVWQVVDIEQSELQCLSLKGVPIFKNPRFENCIPLVNNKQLDRVFSGLKIAPNPVVDKLRFQSEQDLSVCIYNQAGLKILQIVLTKEYPEVNVEQLPIGIYYLHARTLNTNDYFTQKFIKQ